MRFNGVRPLRHNAYKVTLLRNLVKRSVQGAEGVTDGTVSVGNESVGAGDPHQGFLDLLYLFFWAGIAFIVFHVVYAAVWLPKLARANGGQEEAAGGSLRQSSGTPCGPAYSTG